MAERLPMSGAIALMRDAFTCLSDGNAVCPLRLHLPVREHNGCSLIMPCYQPGSGYFGIKTVNIFDDNADLGLPIIQSVYHLYSAETGSLLATMDGTFLTKLRTGAASGLATDLLADPEASTLALFGTGVQAESQLEAVCCVRPIDKILVYGLNQALSEAFILKMRDTLPVELIPAQSPAHLREADVICTATPATSALFSADDIRLGAHINAIGAFRPDMCEVPAELIATGRLIVDQVEAVLEEAGDIIQALQTGLVDRRCIDAELGALLKNDPPQAGHDPSRVSIFKSVGSAVQDIVCAIDLYENTPKDA